MDRRDFDDWVARYQKAWRTPGTQLLDGLFAPDASYRTAPYEPPFEGLEQIERMWEREREGPDEEFQLSYNIVAVEGDTGVIRLEIKYGKPPGKSYRDVWIVVLREDGRCQTFEEWPFWPQGSKGSWPTGPTG